MLEIFSKKMNKLKNQKGFTLVELIVVIAILGILAAVAIGRFGGMTDNAKQKADLSTAASLASAAQVFIAESDTTIADKAVITKENLEKYVEVPTSPRYNKNGEFVVTKDGDGVKVTDSKNTLYPATETIENGVGWSQEGK